MAGLRRKGRKCTAAISKQDSDSKKPITVTVSEVSLEITCSVQELMEGRGSKRSSEDTELRLPPGQRKPAGHSEAQWPGESTTI
eukprot:332442-Hanusia_phi.AAC.1